MSEREILICGTNLRFQLAEGGWAAIQGACLIGLWFVVLR